MKKTKKSKKELLKLLNEKIKKEKKYFKCNKAVPGEGDINAKIMFIGQGPGKEEDKTGRPFIGRAGKFLDKLLMKNKIQRNKVFITSVMKYYLPRNRIPTKEEIEKCLPYVCEQIRIIKPKTIVLMGKIAQEALAQRPMLKKFRVIKTYHPAAGMRFPKIRKKMEKDFKRLKKIF